MNRTEFAAAVETTPLPSEPTADDLHRLFWSDPVYLARLRREVYHPARIQALIADGVDAQAPRVEPPHVVKATPVDADAVERLFGRQSGLRGDPASPGAGRGPTT